jgi:hypothetical protein
MIRNSSIASVMICDAHTHFGRLAFGQDDLSLDTLLRELDRHGIERAVSYSLKGVYCDFAEGNDETLRAAQQHPQIVPLATLDPRRHLGCAEEIARRAAQRFRALRVFPEAQGWPLEFLPFLNLVPAIARCGMALFLSAATNGMATQVVRLLRDSGVTVVLLDVGYGSMAEAIAAAQAYPALRIEMHRIDTPGGVKILADEVGAERVLFGSEAPACAMASPLNLVRAAEIPTADQEKILGGNLAALLGI